MAPFLIGQHGTHPKLFHHRAHRPWQVDFGGPFDSILRWPLGSRDGSASARFDGSRTRTRHHHQGADGPLQYKARDGRIYNLNLIDTPGHVDFSMRSPARWPRVKVRCWLSMPRRGRGADGCQLLHRDRTGSGGGAGPQQDRSAGRGARQRAQRDRGRDRHRRLECDPCSAKTGLGCPKYWRPSSSGSPPKGSPDGPLKALIIDSWFDNYVGVVMLVRVVDGELRPKDRILLMSTGMQYPCDEVGVFAPKAVARDALRAGEVGFIIRESRNWTQPRWAIR